MQMSLELNNGKYMKLRDWIPSDKVDWEMLSSNPNAIPILEKTLDKVNWFRLSSNPNAIPILEKNLDKMTTECWYQLSENPNAIPILEKTLDKVNWSSLSFNPNPIQTTECWTMLSRNPNIFVYDYEAMKTAIYKEGGFVEELMKNRFHPKNMYKFNDWGFFDSGVK